LQTELNLDARPTPWSPDGLILPPGAQIREWRGFEDGLCELQDEGSQLIALATGARPGLAVLDACAGAGGKTLGIAAMMGRKGRLLAIDPDEKKLDELKKRLRRADVPNGEVKASDLEHLDPRAARTLRRGVARRTLHWPRHPAPQPGSGLAFVRRSTGGERRSPKAAFGLGDLDPQAGRPVGLRHLFGGAR
jgi:hypothetical protein